MKKKEKKYFASQMMLVLYPNLADNSEVCRRYQGWLEGAQAAQCLECGQRRRGNKSALNKNTNLFTAMPQIIVCKIVLHP